MAREIYFHIWNGHFKMWGYDCYKSKDYTEIVLYWGKIADSLSHLQQKSKIFTDYWDAYDFIKDKIDDKLRKGYVALKDSDWGRYACEEITLSELIRMIEQLKPEERMRADA